MRGRKGGRRSRGRGSYFPNGGGGAGGGGGVGQTPFSGDGRTLNSNTSNTNNAIPSKSTLSFFFSLQNQFYTPPSLPSFPCPIPTPPLLNPRKYPTLRPPLSFPTFPHYPPPFSLFHFQTQTDPLSFFQLQPHHPPSLPLPR